MPIIIVSSLSYSSGEAVVREVASRLGYECIGQELLKEASERSGVPEEKIRNAVYKAPSLLGMSLATRKRCIAHVQAALCKRLLKDNVLFHGPFGHFLVKGVSHVAKVRIFAPVEERVATKAKLEGCAPKAAAKAISSDDKQRLSLAEAVFAADDDDPNLFDLVINTAKVDVDTAVGIITEAVKHERYRPMTYSLQCMEDLELSCRVKASLIDLDPEVEVEASKGNVRVRTMGDGRGTEKRLGEIRRRVEEHEGVGEVKIETVRKLVDLIDRRLH